ncbi:nitroreductase/quinone reductase family protein [Actinophytocola sediminis]
MTIDFTQQVIEEFRANHGRVGGYFEGARLILLTTTGARTGARHTVPLGYLPDDGDRILVIGSAGGSPRHPAWFHNLVANPLVTVEDGLFSYEAEATVLTGAERAELFARAVEAEPDWADYETRSGRTLPVVALTETGGRQPLATSFGEGLAHIHDAFRRELATIRTEFAAAGPTLGAQLRINCLTVCAGLGFHHQMEDQHMFGTLGERHPELAPVIERLRAEHVTVAGLVEDLRRVVSTGTGGLREVERLIDELEAHLVYEEEQLIPLLDRP